MIFLTRLNGHAMAVNSDLIKLIDSSPDTLLTLLSGEKIVVRESPDEVIARIIDFRRAILSTEPLGAASPHPYSYSRLHEPSRNPCEDR